MEVESFYTDLVASQGTLPPDWYPDWGLGLSLHFLYYLKRIKVSESAQSIDTSVPGVMQQCSKEKAHLKKCNQVSNNGSTRTKAI